MTRQVKKPPVFSKKIRENAALKHFRSKDGATLIEMMVSLLLITILLAMASFALSSATSIFTRMQEIQNAQAIIDITGTHLKNMVKDASEYVKIYDSGISISGQGGSDSGHALEFRNKEGYAVLISDEGCAETSLYRGVSDTPFRKFEAVGKGRLVTRYYIVDSATGQYDYTKGGAAAAREAAKAFGDGFYMKKYIQVTYSYPTDVDDGADVHFMNAHISIYRDEAMTDEIASDSVILDFTYAVKRKDAETAKDG